MLGWEGEFELMVSIALSLALKGGGGGLVRPYANHKRCPHKYISLSPRINAGCQKLNAIEKVSKAVYDMFWFEPYDTFMYRIFN